MTDGPAGQGYRLVICKKRMFCPSSQKMRPAAGDLSLKQSPGLEDPQLGLLLVLQPAGGSLPHDEVVPLPPVPDGPEGGDLLLEGPGLMGSPRYFSFDRSLTYPCIRVVLTVWAEVRLPRGRSGCSRYSRKVPRVLAPGMYLADFTGVEDRAMQDGSLRWRWAWRITTGPLTGQYATATWD
jgi:hypothetical protein